MYRDSRNNLNTEKINDVKIPNISRNMSKDTTKKYEISSRSDPIKRHKKYGTRKRLTIQIVYIIAAILWAVFITYFGFYRTPKAGLIILLIPFFVYGLGFINAKELTVDVEDNVFSANYLSVGLLIVLPLLTWMDKRQNHNTTIVTEAMIVSIVLSLLSLVDIWVRPKWLSVVKHIKSVIQTAALTLLVFALYMFYIGRQQGKTT